MKNNTNNSNAQNIRYGLLNMIGGFLDEFNLLNFDLRGVFL